MLITDSLLSSITITLNNLCRFPPRSLDSAANTINSHQEGVQSTKNTKDEPNLLSDRHKSRLNALDKAVSSFGSPNRAGELTLEMVGKGKQGAASSISAASTIKEPDQVDIILANNPGNFNR